MNPVPEVIVARNLERPPEHATSRHGGGVRETLAAMYDRLRELGGSFFHRGGEGGETGANSGSTWNTEETPPEAEAIEMRRIKETIGIFKKRFRESFMAALWEHRNGFPAQTIEAALQAYDAEHEPFIRQWAENALLRERETRSLIVDNNLLEETASELASTVLHQRVSVREALRQLVPFKDGE